jgi:uncharacterized membrane protein (UPF0127 family)
MNPSFRAALLATALAPGLALGCARAEQATGPPQFLPVSARWCLAAQAHSAAELQAGSRCIELEVADTPRRQAWGMQLRPPLPPLRGMWFPYPLPSLARFWMHLTPEPLDMLFVRGGRVVAVEANATPCPRLPCRSYGPDEPVDGVVELAGGQAEALGLRIGSAVMIEPIEPAGQAPRPATKN